MGKSPSGTCSSPLSPSSPPASILLEVAPPRLISISKRNFSSRSLATIVEDSIVNEKNSAAAASSSNSEQEAMEQFVVPQLASVNGSTVRTTSSDLPMLQREGKESMADRQEQLKSGLSAELRRVVQTQ